MIIKVNVVYFPLKTLEGWEVVKRMQVMSSISVFTLKEFGDDEASAKEFAAKCDRCSTKEVEILVSESEL